MIQSLFRSAHGILSHSLQNSLPLSRSIHASAVRLKCQAGRYRVTKNRDRPLTYEMTNPPHFIAHRKTWNSWNCSNLKDGLRPAETAVEDMFIRKFITGTFPGLLVSEVIIKRQFNHIRIVFLMKRLINPQKTYFLIGYSEEMLANWLQCPITLEIQSVEKPEDVVFKYI